ncbi:DUF624 domain-containing protein [Pengzhenrongella frigida]|uniref:DUF624 domain-containing protein n=1 Tax=Pengzhenrongella frigida TaxID=1259133 RepID=A0A4Q5N1Y3_9MICO|nr:DUF624 domain-containing protein [Cellulomonas sp. HLT2-17]RYV52105.1 DUF624 domain-containing protein [Cellulomonas sp. HLT2-17]
MRPKHETFNQVFSTAYMVLMTNLLLVVACLPFVVGLVVTDPARSWPLLAVVAPLCTPAFAAAFAVFAAFSADGTTAVVRTFVAAWRSLFRRATAIGALATGSLVVLGVDGRLVWSNRWGAVAIPVLVSLAVLVLSTATLALVGVAERPGARLRDLTRASLFLAVRRWYLTVVSLFALVLLVMLVAARPAVGLGLAAAPLLYVVWANSRYALRPALDPGDAPVRAPAS